MTDLPYETFTSVSAVFIGADAVISTSPIVNGPFTHSIKVRDCKARLIAELCLTTEALVALQNCIAAILDDPAEVAAWAARDLAGLALREAMVVT